MGLLCLRPASGGGGAFSFSNACNAYAELLSWMPRFLTFELLRLIPRDVIEKGKGQGAAGSFVTALARGEALLRMRILRNAFPIFELAQPAATAGAAAAAPPFLSLIHI